MNFSWARIRLKLKHFVVTFAPCVLIALIAYGVWLISGSRRTNAKRELRTREASPAEERLLQAAKVNELQAAKPKELRCPESHGARLEDVPEHRHHRGILTWNASASSTNPERKAVGYCLYRFDPKNRDKVKHDKTCNICEQINEKPIKGTACIDTVVEDGAKYYYVATAVNKGGDPSPLSNDVFAEIPPTSQVKASVNVAYPLCRAGNTSK